jgi:hypothetical protein
MTVASVLLVILISSLTSILMGRFYLNWQYHESNSGYRQGKIIEATKEIHNNIIEGGGLVETLRIRHRNSLGLIIERFIKSFGTARIDVPPGSYPILYNANDTNRWSFYDENIKPVIADLNNNGFIGWVPWILNVKRMRTLWYLSHTLEEVIVEQETLRIYEAKNNVRIFHPINDSTVSVSKTGNSSVDAQIEKYLGKMSELKHYWQKWLTLYH